MVLWLGSDVQGSSQVPRGGKLEQEQKGLCRFPVRFPVRLGLRLAAPYFIDFRYNMFTGFLVDSHKYVGESKML